MSNGITMRDMLAAGLHLGHRASYWNPKMAKYVYGKYNQLHIINLEETLPLLQKSMKFLGQLAADGRTILFVGTKRVAQKALAEKAQECGMPYVNQRWLGGLLTNFRMVRRSINRLNKYEAMEKDESLKTLTKKELISHYRTVARLRRDFAGLVTMERLPDALFIIDIRCERLAAIEARRQNIPVVAVVDSNGNPDLADYVIPGNDDSSAAVNFYLQQITDTIIKARDVSEREHADEFVEVTEDKPWPSTPPVIQS